MASVETSPTTATAGPLAHLSAAGISVWLDDLSRDLLDSGALAEDVQSRAVVGVTTNPSIFAKAVDGSDAYDAQLRDLAARGVDVDEAVRMITTADVRRAADVLRGIYDASGGVDGRVSLEVDPRFARNTEATLAEARQLWWLVDRPNLMVKIPATREGLPAIRAAIADGISVNVTLIFSLERYREVVEAFMAGLEDAHAQGRDLSRIGSVASFFISRVDAAVDAELAADSPLRGTAALANARLAFAHHEEVLSSERWRSLAAAGAAPQRPLWASTSVKDDAYPSTMYVDQLVTAGTVNTMPRTTLDAVAALDHEETFADTVRGTSDDARETLDALARAGVDLDAITERLEGEGVTAFADSWDDLLATVSRGVSA